MHGIHPHSGFWKERSFSHCLDFFLWNWFIDNFREALKQRRKEPEPTRLISSFEIDIAPPESVPVFFFQHWIGSYLFSSVFKKSLELKRLCNSPSMEINGIRITNRIQSEDSWNQRVPLAQSSLQFLLKLLFLISVVCLSFLKLVVPEPNLANKIVFAHILLLKFKSSIPWKFPLFGFEGRFLSLVLWSIMLQILMLLPSKKEFELMIVI